MNISIYAIPGVMPGYFETAKNQEKASRKEYYEMILKKVSDHYGVEPKDVLMSSNIKGAKVGDLVKVRKISMALIAQSGRGSTIQIGRFFNRDHATVFYACKSVHNLRRYDKEFREETNVFFN